MRVERKIELLSVCVAGLVALVSACESGGTERGLPTDSERDEAEGEERDGGSRDEPESDAGVRPPSDRKVDGGRTRDASTDAQSDSKADASAARDSGSAQRDASTPGAPSDAASAPADGAPPSEEKPAVACNPADKKPEPTNVPTSSIRRYSGMTIAKAKGPYVPVLESDPGLSDYTIYRPEKLGDRKHPIVVWANGGCSRDGTYFSKFLLEVASYGIIAISDGKPNGSGTRPLGPDGAPQKAALDWIIAENERPCSQYYHKLDVTKTAAMGQSCGGLMTLGASSDKRLTTVALFNSGLFERDMKIYAGLHAPMASFIGGDSDIAYPQAEADVMAINTVPLFYGNLDVGHFATWAEDNAGEFGRVGVAWLRWHLMGDAEAEKVFVGADCELCKPPSKWTVKKKMMD